MTRARMTRGVLGMIVVALALLLALGAGAEGSVLNGLVGHWPFDNGGNLGDDVTANNNDGTVVGAVAASAGLIGAGGATFTNGFINVPDSASLDSAAGAGLDRTVAFWFRTTTAGNTVVLEKGANQHFVVQTESVTAPPGKISFRVDGNNIPRVISLSPVNDSSWHHFAATYEGVGNRMQLFIDGTLQASNIQASPGANNSPLAIGARDNAGVPAVPFPGDMDDVAVWSRELSPEAIARIHAAGLAGKSLGDVAVPTMTAYTWKMLKDNPRFYWSFNETGNTDNAEDLVRRQVNDRLAPQGDARRGGSATSNLAYSGKGDGAGDFFYAANLNDHVMPGAWAIEMWVQAEGDLAGSRGDYLMNAGAGGGNNPAYIYDFGVGGDNKIELIGGGRTAGGGPSVDDNAWHHLVATFYGNGAGFGIADRVDMALDGVVIPNVPRGGFSSGFALNSQLLIAAGLTNGANAFQGRIDEVAFWDLSGLDLAQAIARTQQLAGHYALAFQPSATNLQYVQGATYQISPLTPPGGGAYGDTTPPTKLTDGIIGSSGSGPWGSGEWVGWATVDPILTFDLQRQTDLDALLIDYLVGHQAGVYAPDSVLIELSLNGITFTPYGLVTAFNDFDPGPAGIGWNRRLVVEMGLVDARFVRLTFANDQEWTFLGEVQFIEYTPEPTTLALLGLGGLALLRRRRRAARPARASIPRSGQCCERSWAMLAERRNGRMSSVAFRVLAAAALMIAAGVRLAGAVPVTWTGTASANWSVGGPGGNWNGAGPPVSGDDIVFNNLSTANLATNNNIVGLALAGITAANPVGAVSIGGNAFGVGAGGIDMSAATQNLSISPTLTLSGTPSLNVTGGRRLGVTATPTIAAGSTVSKDGAGILSFGILYLGNNVSNTFTMNSGTMQITGDCRMGQGGQTGTLNQYGGSIQNTGGFFIVGGVAGGAGGKGVYNLWDGSLTANNMYFAWTKDGEINQHGGSVTASRLHSGTDSGNGVYNLSGGSLTIANEGGFGYTAGLQSDFVHTGGTASFGTLYLGGQGTGGVANYTINQTDGPAQLTVGAGGLYAGYSGTGRGNLYLDGGTVQVNGNLSLGFGANTRGNVTQTAGTLDVDGVLNVGGAGVGLFKIVGDDATILVDGYTQNAASTLELDINGISPINVDGIVSLNGRLDIEFLVRPVGGMMFPIIVNDGTDAVVGTFVGLAQGAAFFAPGFDCTVVITYRGLTGNDVVLTAMPEPGTLSLLGLGALALIRRRRGSAK